jgi:hypothetical protein
MKTVASDEGLQDAAGDVEDSAPGIGMGSATPLGDTSEHSDELIRSCLGWFGELVWRGVGFLATSVGGA